MTGDLNDEYPYSRRAHRMVLHYGHFALILNRYKNSTMQYRRWICALSPPLSAARTELQNSKIQDRSIQATDAPGGWPAYFLRRKHTPVAHFRQYWHVRTRALAGCEVPQVFHGPVHVQAEVGRRVRRYHRAIRFVDSILRAGRQSEQITAPTRCVAAGAV